MHPIPKSDILPLPALKTINETMRNELISEEQLPEEKLASLQMDLFSLLDEPTDPTCLDAIYSNSIANIDLVPRFKRGINKAIKSTEIKPNQSLIIENRYHVGQHELICRIQPAIIKQQIEGVQTELHAYPGDREELIEKVLFFIAANKGLETTQYRRWHSSLWCIIHFV